MDIDNVAGKLVKFLLDSDCIQFLVGAKLNQAHYNPALPIDIEIRKNIIKKWLKFYRINISKKLIYSTFEEGISQQGKVDYNGQENKC